MKQKINLKLAITSGVVILGGVILSVLLPFVTVKEGGWMHNQDDHQEWMHNTAHPTGWMHNTDDHQEWLQNHVDNQKWMHTTDHPTGWMRNTDHPTGWVHRADYDERVYEHDYPEGIVWIFGLVYIIPGILGLVAACIQNKRMYVLTCIFATISLIIMGIFVATSVLELIDLVFRYGNIPEHCKDTQDGCECRHDQVHDFYTHTYFKICANLEIYRFLAIALLTFLVLTWVAEITELVLVYCYICPCKKPTADVVSMPSDQPILEPGSDEVHGISYLKLQNYGQGDALLENV